MNKKDFKLHKIREKNAFLNATCGYSDWKMTEVVRGECVGQVWGKNIYLFIYLFTHIYYVYLYIHMPRRNLFTLQGLHLWYGQFIRKVTENIKS